MDLMDDVKKWRAVYRLLDQVSTEVFDCGTLCGSVCCTCQAEEELGIYLFPGEHLLLKEHAQGFPGDPAAEPANGSADNSVAESAADSAAEPADNSADDPSDGHVDDSADGPAAGEELSSDWLSWSVQDPGELGFPDSWTGPVYFVKCQTPPRCPRRWRPLQCRTFPLKPVIGENGVLELIWNDEELPYQCPIIEKNMPIHDDFYKATYTVWTHLLRDRRILELVMQWS